MEYVLIHNMLAHGRDDEAVNKAIVTIESMVKAEKESMVGSTDLGVCPYFGCFVVPMVGEDPFREQGETYAQSLRNYIEFVLEREWAESIVDTVIF